IYILFIIKLFQVIFNFFFFQAEDGIRDFHVTGVQTCALPILFRVLPCVSLLTCSLHLCAQDDVTYLNPPQVIADMLLAKPTPMVSINNKGTWMLLMEYEEIGRASCRERVWISVVEGK